jgi:L-ascorbate metabolism protein UlaG (beta-lactamase superfamily)
MKITKYEHACLVMEEQGQKLLVDPGIFSTSCTDFNNVTAVIVTHVHPDHLDKEKLTAIQAASPGVNIYTVQDVAKKLKGSIPVTVVTSGSKVEAGLFKLEFFGSQHAVIHESIPVTDNVGIMVNSKLYYPGDSFTLPHQPVDTLAVPASAPWLRVGEAMDFITAVKPKQVFPTHNAILSEIGSSIYDHWLNMACTSVAAKYLTPKPGDFINL